MLVSLLSRETIREVNSACRLDHHKNKRCGRHGGNEKSRQIALGVSGLEEKFFWWKKGFSASLCVFLLSMWIETLISRETEVYIREITWRSRSCAGNRLSFVLFLVYLIRDPYTLS
jgi:hypothetical protein